MSGTPLERVKEAAKRFSKAVLNSDGSNYLAVVTLSSDAQVACNFTNDISKLNKAINAASASGGTNMNAALQKAGELLNKKSGGNGVMKNIILCSDGLPKNGKKASSGRYKLSNHKDYKYANAVYKTDVALKNKDYFIYALGFFHNSSGKDLTFGKKLMKDLASKDKYFIVTKPADVDEVFDKIAAEITSVAINNTELTLYVGDTDTLKVSVNGKAAKATWKTSKKSVVTVNSSGKVTAKKAGTATITGTVNGKSVTCKITVKKKAMSIELDKSNATIYVGGSVTLKAAVTGTSKTVKWSTSKKSIATVKKGKVTGVAPGTVTITAKANGKTDTCKVTVKKPTISLDKTTLKLAVGKSATLKATVNGPSQKVVWESMNKNLATVDNTGKVTAVKAGTVTIKVTANGVSATCTVTVNEKRSGEIYTVADLKKVADNLDGTYYLMKDLNLGSEPWTPIGTEKNPFKGKFYGNGHTISNLYINGNKDDQGVFGYVSQGLIQELEVTGNVVGGTYAAGIVGRLGSGSKIAYCINRADVSGGHQIGGVVGRVAGGTVEYCLNYGKIVTNGRGSGGITADIYPSGKVLNSVNLADISGGSDITGGIVGGSTSGTVSGCYNTGNITGSSRKGAIAGDNASYSGSRSNNHFLKTAAINTGFSPIGTGSGTFSTLQDQGLKNAIAAITKKF